MSGSEFPFLAKLKRINPDGDVKQYLQNEMYQNLKAIEDAIKQSGNNFSSISTSLSKTQMKVEILNTNGNFIIPSNTTKNTVFKITCVGGGAGGAKSTNGAGGGGAGATSYKWATGYESGSIWTIVIGAAGAGTSTNNDSGTDGSNSSVQDANSVYLTVAYGGSKGVANGAEYGGGAGGTGAIGDIVVSGGSGGPNLPGTPDNFSQGNGGQSSMSGGGVGSLANFGRVAASAVGYGGGGGATSNAAGTSGNGSAGVVIIEWIG